LGFNVCQGSMTSCPDTHPVSSRPFPGQLLTSPEEMPRALVVWLN